MPVVRTDGRAVYGHVITKFSGWVDLLTHGASLERARAPLEHLILVKIKNIIH